MPQLSALDLYSFPDHDVQTKVTEQFLSQVKNCHLVKDTFFASEPPPLFPPYKPVAIDQIATALICVSISRTTLYGFGACVNAVGALAFLQMRLQDTDVLGCGQSLYSSLFPDYTKSANSCFRDYMQDGPNWAQELAAVVTTPEFVNKDMQGIFTQANWLDTLNLIFFKIDQLDPTVTNSVLTVWTKAYPDKSIVKNWDHRQFVPYQNISQAPDEFISDVNGAISVGTEAEDGADCTVYGHAVSKFLVGYPKKLNFLTGAHPQNKVDHNHRLFGVL